MRFVQDIPHTRFRIGLYAWNGKYIVKIEAGPYEQTYKISEMDLGDPESVPTMLDEPFLTRVAQRFPGDGYRLAGHGRAERGVLRNPLHSQPKKIHNLQHQLRIITRTNR